MPEGSHPRAWSGCTSNRYVASRRIGPKRCTPRQGSRRLHKAVLQACGNIVVSSMSVPLDRKLFRIPSSRPGKSQAITPMSVWGAFLIHRDNIGLMRQRNKNNFGDGYIFLKNVNTLPVAVDLDLSFLAGEDHPKFPLEFRSDL